VIKPQTEKRKNKTEQSLTKGSRNKTDPEHKKHKKSFEIKFLLGSLEKPVQAPVGIYEGQSLLKTEILAPKINRNRLKSIPGGSKRTKNV